MIPAVAATGSPPVWPLAAAGDEEGGEIGVVEVGNVLAEALLELAVGDVEAAESLVTKADLVEAA